MDSNYYKRTLSLFGRDDTRQAKSDPSGREQAPKVKKTIKEMLLEPNFAME